MKLNQLNVQHMLALLKCGVQPKRVVDIGWPLTQCTQTTDVDHVDYGWMQIQWPRTLYTWYKWVTNKAIVVHSTSLVADNWVGPDVGIVNEHNENSFYIEDAVVVPTLASITGLDMRGGRETFICIQVR